MSATQQASGLAALEARLQQDLAWLNLPAKPWVPAHPPVDGIAVEDVVIVGGGMAGLTLAAALRHAGVNARLVDRAPAGCEGPWVTTARMQTLRSPKELSGPCLGLPALTFRAWYEARHGAAAWQTLAYIERLDWAAYLRWYRHVLGLAVDNERDVTAVEPRADGLVALRLKSLRDAVTTTALARHVVLATGRDGLGGPWVPAWAAQLPRNRWAHSSDRWEGETLRGRRVAVIGGGASAMDAAATALEHGAARVDLLIRRPDLPRVNRAKGIGNPGMAQGFCQLPDAWKWRFRHAINVTQVPPPHLSTLRVSRHANAHFHFGAPVEAARQRADGALRLDTPQGALACDFVIFCTGFRIDWAQRPEFSALAPHVRLWRDRYRPAAGEEDAELADSPDLGPSYEFQQKVPGGLPGLERVHCFNYAAALSQGASAGDIPQISDGAQRLAHGLIASLLAEDVAQHYADLQDFAEPELDGTEWSPSPLPRYEEEPFPARRPT